MCECLCYLQFAVKSIRVGHVETMKLCNSEIKTCGCYKQRQAISKTTMTNRKLDTKSLGMLQYIKLILSSNLKSCSSILSISFGQSFSSLAQSSMPWVKFWNNWTIDRQVICKCDFMGLEFNMSFIAILPHSVVISDLWPWFVTIWEWFLMFFVKLS